MDLKEFGLRIANLRKGAKLSQEKLAGLAKISRGALQQLEDGEGNPTMATILAIGSVLKFNPFNLDEDEFKSLKPSSPEISEKIIKKAMMGAVKELFPREFNSTLKSPSKEYSALSPIPPELFEKYNTDLSHQLLTHYFLTREDRYIEHLGTEILSHIEAISRLLGLKRSP